MSNQRFIGSKDKNTLYRVYNEEGLILRETIPIFPTLTKYHK